MEERIYTIPLRDAYKATRVKRAKKAITLIRQFLKRHMKAEEFTKVKIGQSINEEVWERGAKKPARRVRVHTVKEDGMVYAELIGTDIKTPTSTEKVAKEKKTVEKKEKIKEARKERKHMSIQEELDESGTLETVEEEVEVTEDAPAEETTEAPKEEAKPETTEAPVEAPVKEELKTETPVEEAKSVENTETPTSEKSE
jgi:large subunit ribosomal protein L31e